MTKWNDDEEEMKNAPNKGLFEKFLNVFGIEADEEIVEDDEVAATQEEPVSRKELKERGKLVSLTHNNKPVKMIISDPTSFEDVQAIVDHLKNKRAVILNLEETDKTVARRIADFLSGATYALEGSMQKVSASIFLFTPAHIEVSVPIRTELREREKEKDRSSQSSNFSSTLFRKDRDRK
jgi:cell division inhibitor SepF